LAEPSPVLFYPISSTEVCWGCRGYCHQQQRTSGILLSGGMRVPWWYCWQPGAPSASLTVHSMCISLNVCGQHRSALLPLMSSRW
jgi:hypothetical protein